MANKKPLNLEALGEGKLSLAEKVNVLSARCRAQGVYLHDLVGISTVTLSKVANLQCAATRKVRDALIEAAHGFIVEMDFLGPQPRLRKAPTKPAKAPAAPKPTEDEDLDI